MTKPTKKQAIERAQRRRAALRLAALRRKQERLSESIGYLMTQRANVEDEIERLNRQLHELAIGVVRP